MKHELIVRFLVLALAISLGVNLYYYSVMVNNQATINDMRGHIVVAWARQMSVAAYYLENVTTNIDIDGVKYLFWIARNVAESASISDGTIYSEMTYTASFVHEKLSLYSEGSPTFVKRINSTAIEMIKNLAQRIRDTTALILGDIEVDLISREGVNPIKLLREKGVLDEVVNGLVDVRNLAQQIHNFSPKFQ